MRSQLFVKNLLTMWSSRRSIILIICAVAMLIELPRLASYFRIVEQPHVSHGLVLIQPQPPAYLETIKTGSAAPAPLADQKPAQSLAATSAAPAQEMITALQDNRAALNLQAAQDVINGRVPAISIPAAGSGVQSEGYLPPWAASRGQDAAAQVFEGKSGNDTGLTMPVAAQPVHAEVRRTNKRRSANARRKAKVPSSPFGGLFGF